MPRLKVFQAHIGFHDLIVAAASQAKALAAWGGKPTEFQYGFAKETKDAQAVEAALAQPGVVLKRPHGSKGIYKVEADAPKAPRLSKAQKTKQSKREAERKKKLAAAAQKAKVRQRAREKAERKAQLAEIAQQETTLRKRRKALEKKLKVSR
jgi:hypothetical protein